MRIKPRKYNGETTCRNYRSHFDEVYGLNELETAKLLYVWVNLEIVAFSFIEDYQQLPS